mmetsp:Transcript_5491/g.23243  ORF Transcript_5491/g.23243 Transcript_5491/m.23243 type:complete len:225 (+) Transcript_5491:210-884(+)
MRRHQPRRKAHRVRPAHLHGLPGPRHGVGLRLGRAQRKHHRPHRGAHPQARPPQGHGARRQLQLRRVLPRVARRGGRQHHRHLGPGGRRGRLRLPGRLPRRHDAPLAQHRPPPPRVGGPVQPAQVAPGHGAPPYLPGGVHARHHPPLHQLHLPGPNGQVPVGRHGLWRRHRDERRVGALRPRVQEPLQQGSHRPRLRRRPPRGPGPHCLRQRRRHPRSALHRAP